MSGWVYVLEVASTTAPGAASLHGTFKREERADAQRDRWQRVLDARFGPGQVRVTVRLVRTATAQDRDWAWPAPPATYGITDAS